jgi:hypothetical protein
MKLWFPLRARNVFDYLSDYKLLEKDSCYVTEAPKVSLISQFTNVDRLAFNIT